MPRVALEPAVGEGSLLEHPEPPNAVVRLSEDAHAEQPERDDQDSTADDGDEQLRSDRGRHAADAADEALSLGPGRRGAPDGAARAGAGRRAGTASGASCADAPARLVISQRPLILATSPSAAVTAATLPVLGST